MSGWFKRPRYRLVQVQAGQRHALTGSFSRREADRYATQVNQQLGLYKLLAPSGPQDAHVVVEEL